MSDNNSQRVKREEALSTRFCGRGRKGTSRQNGERRLHEISGLPKLIQRCVQFLKGAHHVIWPQLSCGRGAQPATKVEELILPRLLDSNNLGFLLRNMGKERDSKELKSPTFHNGYSSSLVARPKRCHLVYGRSRSGVGELTVAHTFFLPAIFFAQPWGATRESDFVPNPPSMRFFTKLWQVSRTTPLHSHYHISRRVVMDPLIVIYGSTGTGKSDVSKLPSPPPSLPICP